MTGYQDVTLPQGIGTEPWVHDRVPRCYPTPGYGDRFLSTWQGIKMLPYPRVRGQNLEYMTGYQDVTLPQGIGTEPWVHDRVPRCYPTPGYGDRALSTWQGTKMLPYPRVRGQNLEYMTGYQDVTLPQGTGTEPWVHDRVPRCYPTPGYGDRTLSTWQGTKMLPYPRVQGKNPSNGCQATCHTVSSVNDYIDGLDGLVQERRNSSALAMELRLSCTNPSICVVQRSG